jgi:hypothetical protein
MILCRRCHMAVDGRLEANAKRAHKINAKARKKAPKHCRICNRPVPIGYTKKGRCKTCDTYWRRNGSERPYGLLDGRKVDGSLRPCLEG